jgi:glucosamine--fructose-6-phosphate aminotransferase (isomerizing)
MATTSTFDPTAPLPAPPDPWTPSDMPSARSGPPYHMTEMIAAEPHLARRLLGRLARPGSPAEELTGAVRDALTARQPVVVTGCGTSEHAAQGVAEILREAARAARLAQEPNAVVAAQALEAALDPQRTGLLIGISHEGGSAASNASMHAARSNGVQVALITAGPASPGAALADIVVTTDEMDQSWCHTIGYTAPLLTAAAVGAALSRQVLDPNRVAELMAAGAANESVGEAIAGTLARTRHIIVIASGADRPAARELVLKIEEAAWIPSAMRDLETFLHGHLPATGEEMGLVLILTEREHRAERTKRAAQALAAARGVGVQVAAIVSTEVAGALPKDAAPVGSLVIPEAPDLPAPVAALLGSATALQLVTERIARATGRNPDAIRRDEDRYREAAAAAE